jgi:hypothetical protein
MIRRLHFPSVSTRLWGPDTFLKWVEGVALHIGDPVARLRFLRIAAPCAETAAPPLPCRRTHMPLVDLALVVFLILSFTMVGVSFVKVPRAPAATVHRQKAEQRH